MGKYGETAIHAVKLITDGNIKDPRDAWKAAAQRVFPHSASMRDKGCPRSTFLGLCAEGLIRGVSGGSYTTSSSNKSYGVRAVQILRRRPELAESERELWLAVTRGTHKAPNQQMDVVITLWDRDFLTPTPATGDNA
jgi:hypothetical protein